MPDSNATLEICTVAVCKEIKTFSRTHERIADLFSLGAVALLFASVWVTLEYHQAMIAWLRHDAVLHGTLLVAALALDVFLILGFLAVGSARFGADNEKCFGTFRGRRNHNGSPVGIVNAWINHMESVGKKHR
jgi:hypothetical protein